jgi:hypothetical protein
VNLSFKEGAHRPQFDALCRPGGSQQNRAGHVLEANLDECVNPACQYSKGRGDRVL